MIKKTLSLVVVLVLALLLCSMPVAAQMPPEGHIFFGSVSIDASSAPDGTTVSAHIGSLSWSTTTSVGKYGYDPFFLIPLDDPDTSEKDGGEDGDEIIFKVNGEVVASYTFETNMGTELDLSISTTAVYYTLTVDVSPSGGGTVALSPSRSGNQYEFGTTVTLTANAASGYVFDHWSGDVSGSTNPTTITMDGDKSVSANFEETAVSQYDLTISSAAGGSVLEPGEGTFPYDAGEEVQLEASPDDGYEFDEWTGDVDTVADADDPTTTITMDADKSITAVFAVVTPGTLPASFSASNLLISPQQVQPNQQVEISINIANDGGATGSHTVLLYINGNLEDSRTVKISAGLLQNVAFTVTRSTPGTYEVSLEGLQGQFTVVASSAVAPSAATPSPGGLDTGTMIVIVAIIVALVAAIVFVIFRARRA